MSLTAVFSTIHESHYTIQLTFTFIWITLSKKYLVLAK